MAILIFVKEVLTHLRTIADQDKRRIPRKHVRWQPAGAAGSPTGCTAIHGEKRELPRSVARTATFLSNLPVRPASANTTRRNGRDAAMA
jgi:hypothetical protein